MTDNAQILDNTAAETTRSIIARLGSQSFKNSATDLSYSLNPASSSSPADTNDYYRLVVERKSNVILSLLGLTGNANLALLDSSGNPLESLEQSTNSSTTPDAIVRRGVEALAAGTYYVRVYTSDTSATSNYTLNVESSPTIRSDLLWRNYQTGVNELWQMNGTSIAQTTTQAPRPNLNWTLEAGVDMDGDGNLDTIWRNSTNGRNQVFLQDAQGQVIRVLELNTVAGAENQIAAVVDLNGDRNSDIVWSNTRTGKNQVWLMNKTTYASTVVLPTEPDRNWVMVAAADFDQNGTNDLLWRNRSAKKLRVWLMNKTTYVGQRSLTQPSQVSDFQFGGLGDVNGDGSVDIVWRERSGQGRNYAWYLNKTTFLSEVQIGTPRADLNWRIADVVRTSVDPDLAGNDFKSAFNVGSLDGSASYKDGIGSTDRQDYYRFAIAGRSIAKLSITGLSNTAQVQLVRDANRNNIIEANEIVTTATRNPNTGVYGTASDIRLDTAGEYYVRIVDSSASSRNYRMTLTAKAYTPIDLQPTAVATNVNTISLPASGQTSITLNYSIRNNVANAGSAYKVGFYISTDSTITTTDKRLFLSSALTIAGGQTQSLSQPLSLPDRNDPFWRGDQPYYIGVIADPDLEVIETNENNNSIEGARIQVNGIGRADLTSNSLNVAGGGTPGSRITLSGTIQNIGGRDSGASNTDIFTVKFFLSTDQVLDSNDYDLQAGATFRPILKGSSVSFTSTNTTDETRPLFDTSEILLPGQNEGFDWASGSRTYYVLMQIDDTQQVDEINDEDSGTNNNIRSAAISVNA